MSGSRFVTDPLARAALTLLSPPGRFGRLTILIYHRVLERPDPLQDIPDAREFRRQMELVRRCFRPLPLPEAVARLKAGGLPARALCVTFDDGYRDNHEVALPILQELGIPATFFVATAYLDGGLMFNDRVIETLRRLPPGEYELDWLEQEPLVIDGEESRRALVPRLLGSLKYRPQHERQEASERFAALAPEPLPTDLMMESEQVRNLHQAGMTIGAHTHTHPILTRIPCEGAREEITRGRERLEEITGAPVTLFAYPNGQPVIDYDECHAAMVRELGFEAALSTRWGAADVGSDPFQLPRFTPWDRSDGRYLLRLGMNYLGIE